MIRRAIIHTLISRQISTVFMGVGMLVLARLLTPDEFGAFALARAIFAVAEVIADFGLEARLARDKQVSKDDYGSAVGLSFMVALALIVVGAGLCWIIPAAILPGETVSLLALMAPAIFARPLRLMVEPQLVRDLKFGLLSVAMTVQLTLEALVGIALALAGMGAHALAGGVLVSHLVAAVLVLVARRGMVALPSRHGWRRLLSFNGMFSGANLLTRGRDLVVTMVIGGMLGLTALGIFNRATAVVTLLDRSLLEGITRVMMPAISRSMDAGMASARIYLAKIDYLAALMWPVFAGIAVLAEPLVAVLLGAQWDAAVPITRILCLIGLAMPFNRMSLKIFAAIDALPTYFRLHLNNNILTLVMVTGGSLYSLTAAAWAFGASQLIKAVLIGISLKQLIAYSSREFLAIAARAALASGVVAVLAGASQAMLAGSPAWVTLAVGITACAIGLLVVLVTTRHPLIGQVLEIARPLGRRFAGGGRPS